MRLEDRIAYAWRVMANTGGRSAPEWSGQAIDASASARPAAHPIESIIGRDGLALEREGQGDALTGDKKGTRR
jgi:hypothetical protein